MNKVYVVTDGCYSDYHIVNMFTSKARAENLVAILNHGTGEDADIEEWDVLDDDDPIEYYVRIHTQIRPNGEISSTFEKSDLGKAYDPNSSRVHEWGGGYASVSTQWDPADIERGRKVHNDNVAKKRAEMIGL